MILNSFFLLTSVFFLILSTVPGFQVGLSFLSSWVQTFSLECHSRLVGSRNWHGWWRGNFVLEDHWSHLCWLVHFGIYNQISRLSAQGKHIFQIKCFDSRWQQFSRTLSSPSSTLLICLEYSLSMSPCFSISSRLNTLWSILLKLLKFSVFWES